MKETILSDEETEMCLSGLYLVGTQADFDVIKELVTKPTTRSSVTAIKIRIKFAPDRIAAAREVVSTPSAQTVLAIIDLYVEGVLKDTWPILEPLLLHHEDDIRRLVCLFAAQIKKRAELLLLLSKYLSAATYFYDVVFLLDLVLYAPRRIVSYRVQEMFEKNPDYLVVFQKIQNRVDRKASPEAT